MKTQEAIEIINKSTNDSHTIECFRSGKSDIDYQIRKAERRTTQDYDWLMMDIREAGEAIKAQISNSPESA